MNAFQIIAAVLLAAFTVILMLTAIKRPLPAVDRMSEEEKSLVGRYRVFQLLSNAALVVVSAIPVILPHMQVAYKYWLSGVAGVVVTINYLSINPHYRRLRQLTKVAADEGLICRVQQIARHFGKIVHKVIIDDSGGGRTRAYCNAGAGDPNITVSRFLLEIATPEELDFLVASAIVCTQAPPPKSKNITLLEFCSVVPLIAWFVLIMSGILRPNNPWFVGLIPVWGLASWIGLSRHVSDINKPDYYHIFRADREALLLTKNLAAAESILTKKIVSEAGQRDHSRSAEVERSRKRLENIRAGAAQPWNTI